MAWFGESFNDGLSSLKGQITKITKEVLSEDPLAATSFEGRIDNLEEECAAQAKLVQKLQEENEKLKTSHGCCEHNQLISQLEEQLKQLTSEKESLNNSLDLLDSEHQSEIQIVLEERDKASASHEAILQKLERENEEKNKQIWAFCQEMESIVGRRTAKPDEVTSYAKIIKQMLDTNINQNQSLNDEIIALKNENNQLSQLSDKVKQLELENCELTSQVAQLKDQSCITQQLSEDDVQSEQLPFEDELSKAISILNRLKNTKENHLTIKKAIIQAVGDLLQDHLNSELDSLETVSPTHVATNDNLERENVSLKERIEKLEGVSAENALLKQNLNELEGITTEKETLQSNLLQVKEILSEKEEKLEKLISDNKCLNENLRKLEISIDDTVLLGKKLNQVLAENVVLKENLEQLEMVSAENELVKQKLEKLDVLMSENVEIKQQLAKTKQDLSDSESLKEHLEAMRVDKIALEEKLEKMNGELAENDGLKEKLRILEGVETDNLSLKTQLDKSEGENKAFNEKLSQLHAENVNLKEKLEGVEGLEASGLITAGLGEQIQKLGALVSRMRSEFRTEPPSALAEAHSQTDDVKRLHLHVEQMTHIIRLIDQGLTSIYQDKSSLEQQLTEAAQNKQLLEANLHEWTQAVAYRDQLIQNLTSVKDQHLQQIHQLKTEKTNLEEMVSLQKQTPLELNESKPLVGNPDNTETRQVSSQQDQVNRLLEENADLKGLVQQLRETIVAMNSANSQQDQTENCKKAAEIDIEQYNNVLSQNQVLLEKESSLRREVERLRGHLVEVEEHYTEETMLTETQLSECRAKLAAAEDQLRNSTTHYKSANVRSNQHLEALQTQLQLISVQRNDLQEKLSLAEDNAQKQAVALTSLQHVLEQFQLDKQRELHSAEDKHAHQIDLQRRRANELEDQIEALHQQLADAKNGLKAALRLGEQLENKSATIAHLEEELSKSKNELSSANQQLAAISQSTAGKIDKSLVKNLVMGYLAAQGERKAQTLKILASVLELSAEEKTRAGVEGHSGWLASFLHPSNASDQPSESLSQAFVRFLENESRPQPQLKLLVEPSPAAATARRAPPLLLSDLVLPSVSPTQINDPPLSHVLNDS